MENKCKTCGKKVESELIDMCYECVQAKQLSGKFTTYTYNTNLNFVPKPKEVINT